MEEHATTHWPFREWCDHCIIGKAKSSRHYRRKQESEVPITAVDYMWMIDGDDPRDEDLRGMPILVAADECTDWICAWVFPEKGETWYAIRALAGYIEDTGHKRVIMKSDQEPAIIKLKAAVMREIERGSVRIIPSGRVEVTG